MTVMLKARLIRLETWLKLTYGEDAPSVFAARRWLKAGKIQPAPVKHGRSYFVDPEARYTEPPRKPRKLRLVDRIAEEAPAR